MIEAFLNDRVILHPGDCLDVLAQLDECSLDACVTDPPYGIQFMGRGWDHGVPGLPYWQQVYRVLKPGAHLVACGGTRTYHRLACAIEDAGFEIRDTISWIYGSGFPKSHSVSGAIDKAAGEQRERIRGVRSGVVQGVYAQDAWSKEFKDSVLSSEPITDAARQWQGWGTALKPACELIVLARKPLSEGTVAANVLRWGTGAINVDGCRVGTGANDPNRRDNASVDNHGGIGGDGVYSGGAQTSRAPTLQQGRWPANVVHDGSDEVVAAFPDAPGQQGDVRGTEASHTGDANTNCYGEYGRVPFAKRDDSGSAARFFYTARPDEPSADRRYTNEGSTNFSALPGARRDAVSPSRLFYTSKADADDRLGSKHPTVKPLDLMQWLVRLVCRKGGTVLDPFSGTGTTGEAAWREGVRAVLIEAEPEYQADIRRRMALVLAGPDERIRESIKAKNLPRDDGPLFDGLQEAAE